MAETAGVRRWGAAALDLAYVAAGRFDGFWERGLSPWDIAAGLILVREAGGYVSEMNGKAIGLASPSILASNNAIHSDLMKLLRKPLSNQKAQ
jgi:myo-inositol-1(or 4)-monophosphatase